MRDPRSVLCVGGDNDGRIVTILHGRSIRLPDGKGSVEQYDIVELAGRSRNFGVAVPAGHQSDGDWLMTRLLSNYHPAIARMAASIGGTPR